MDSTATAVQLSREAEQARHTWEAAVERRDEAIRTALADGATPTELARQTRIPRQRIYRIAS